ncbi:glutaminyl-peptide cyclotransferase [Deinococcus peraridilitoris]|uniref:Glutamine cyclotransferase n=1 Tax=Deinococcus peraridilitoris (strain DSM 19664 / LMG 22246 / CIP 109416 / KR-200) TaxID=937777 RepID=L0A6B2_DEIPD|nr:glutaminyl-peptide cyclotransferase [Deinococcus peraridilitoris]AFZ69423.1 glutamine cyclotransferase [Deinococcus peraridilitoris DSM 19664]
MKAIALPLLAGTAALGGTVFITQQQPRVITPAVLHTLPHDSQAFTQGLVIHHGRLFESTGLYGYSKLREVELTTGKVKRRTKLPENIFAEGLAQSGNDLVQLTWRNGFARIVDRESFKQKGQFTYHGEGWGLTQDGTHLILSDGSNVLRFLNPKTYQVERQLAVQTKDSLVTYLNELEYGHGYILANVWLTTRIAVIDPDTGFVERWIDLSKIAQEHLNSDKDNVLNGIVYNPADETLYVTGKRWNKAYLLSAKDVLPKPREE